MKDIKVLIVTEKTATASIISDIFTFGCLFGGFFINHYLLGSSTLLNVFVCALVIIIIGGESNDSIVKMTPDEALSYLDEQETIKKLDKL